VIVIATDQASPSVRRRPCPRRSAPPRRPWPRPTPSPSCNPVTRQPMKPSFKDITVARELANGTRSETYQIGIAGGTVPGRPDGSPDGLRSHHRVEWEERTLVIENGSYTGPTRESGQWAERREVWSLDPGGGFAWRSPHAAPLVLRVQSRSCIGGRDRLHPYRIVRSRVMRFIAVGGSPHRIRRSDAWGSAERRPVPRGSCRRVG
jgi:hypothetical protein